MDRAALMRLLPHRDGMLLLDGAERDGGEARGRLRIRSDAWFLQGHFPGNPVTPGVILCEALAQTACVLLEEQLAAGLVPMYAGIDNARFRAPVRPGDLLETRCRITKLRPPLCFAEGEGYVDGRLCVDAAFSLALVPFDR